MSVTEALKLFSALWGAGLTAWAIYQRLSINSFLSGAWVGTAKFSDSPKTSVDVTAYFNPSGNKLDASVDFTCFRIQPSATCREVFMRGNDLLQKGEKVKGITKVGRCFKLSFAFGFQVPFNGYELEKHSHPSEYRYEFEVVDFFLQPEMTFTVQIGHRIVSGKLCKI